MEVSEILSVICKKYKDILGGNLHGIYLHGSLAFGCFNWQKSDIDFLVVANENLTLKQKEMMIRTLLQLTPDAPPKGLEMSVVLYQNCKNFKYPTPFELHFSNMHIKKAKENLNEYCLTMNGTDYDLAAHFTVIRSVGIVLYGDSIENVFGVVPKKYYLASVKSDVEDLENQFERNSIYLTLNLCRVLAYIRTNLILSKEQGGIWGVDNLPEKFAPIVQNALDCYLSDKEMNIDAKVGQEFCLYMKNAIFQNKCKC